MSDSEAALAQEIARLCRLYLERHVRLIDLGDAGRFERDAAGQVCFAVPVGHGELARFPIDEAPSVTWTWRAALVGTLDGNTLLMLASASDAAGAQLALDAQIIHYVIDEIGADALREMLHRSRAGTAARPERSARCRTHAVSPRRRAGC
jgi:hypothetical protein